MKIIEKKLLKFKNIEIIYATEKQYWGITLLGVKKCIGLEIFNIFLKNKYLISYKDSKFIKKGVKFKWVVNGIEIYLKGICKIIEILNYNEIKSKKFDAYYTNELAVNLCMTSYCKIVSIDSESDLVIEPSAGAGSFCNKIQNVCQNKIYLDINPKNVDILKQNFLTFELNTSKYKKIHIIGNPPFKQLSSFIRKASEIGDFIGFILPLSFKKDSQQKKFPLNFHCIFLEELPKNSFLFENKVVNVPAVFQI